MRLINIIYQKYRILGFLILCAFFSGNLIAQEPEEKENILDVTIKVTDENGNPIPNATVIVGEGNLHTNTDANGTLNILAPSGDVITVKVKGYQTSVVSVDALVKDSNVKLLKSKLMMGEDDVVYLPFNTLKKRSLTNSSKVISGELLSSYPSADIRNTFTGLAPGVEVIERSGAPGVHAQEGSGRFSITDKISLNTRGLGMEYMVDGVPVDITQIPLDPEEIESVTVLKDIVAKAMFGPAAADGVIYITTKRGVRNERSLKVDIENGIRMVDRMPEFVSGTEYATLLNQALVNSGLPERYTSDQIAGFALNDPYNLKTPNIDFRKMMLKDNMPYRRVNMSSSGGNNSVQYFAYLGYTGEGDIYKIGPTSDYNRINTRSNIDIKINDFLKVKFDFYGSLNFRRSSNYGFTTDYGNEGNSFQNIHEFNSVISDITSIPPVAFPLHVGYDERSNNPWYGVSNNYSQNPIGNILGNGYYTEQTRTGASNVELDYDMNSILKGLTSRSYLGINILNLTRLGKAEDYIAYIPRFVPGVTTPDSLVLGNTSHTGFDMTSQAKLFDYYSHSYRMFQNFTYERTFGNHDIQTSLTYFLSKVVLNDTEEPRRLQNGVWSANYSYRNKYIIQGVFNYAGTYAFDKGQRTAFFPAGGAAWVISEEGFMSNLKAVNYLKLRAEYGSIGYENFFAPFRYRDDWNTATGGAFGPNSNFTRWFGTNTDNSVYRVMPSRIGNPNITWEKRKEFNVGFDALLLNEKLSFEITYYNSLRDGILSQLSNTQPYLTGISSARPVFNYNTVRYTGIELGIQYTSKVGEFDYSVGGNAAFQGSEVIKYDVPNYRNSYQSFIGKSLGTIMGQTYIGKFETDAEALVVPQLFDEVLRAGDLKYKDINNDGFVDESDQSAIGNSTPKVIYALNARFKYKNFDLYIMGTGRYDYDIMMSNRYFWNGWGDNTFSTFVRDNIGGDYPRLTYYRVNNNFVGSNFWMRDGSFFKIQNVELGYTIQAKHLKFIRSSGIRIYARGANLLTISKIKDVDPEYINSGVSDYPLFRSFTGGVKFTF